MKSFASARQTIFYSLLAFAIMMLPRWQGLIDLPGHAARFFVERNIDTNADLARFYEFHWSLLPNLGVDLLVSALGRMVGLELAIRIIVALVPVTWIVGAHAISRAVYGKIAVTGTLVVVLAFSYPFVFGFVNYCLSAGLCLIAAAAWIKLTRSGQYGARLAFAIVASPVLLIAHLTGWGAFGLIAFGTTVAIQRERGVPQALIAATRACLPLAWPLLLLVARAGTGAGETNGWLDYAEDVRGIVSVLRDRFMTIDIASAGLLYGVALLPLLMMRRFVYERLLLYPAILIWVAVVLLPSMMLGSAFANVRLIPLALVLTILAVKPRKALPKFVPPLIHLFVLLRLIITATTLLHFDAVAQRHLAALDHVQRGSRVLAFRMHECGRQWEPPRASNLNLLATMRRDVLTNGHFTENGAQLMTVNYPAGGDLMHYGTNAVMSEPCARWNHPTLEAAISAAPLAAFDYLWLMDVPTARLPRDPRLRLVWRREGTALFVVRRNPEPGQ